MKKALKTAWKTMKWTFIVFCIYIGSLFFREEHIPGAWAEGLARQVLPSNLVLHIGSVSFGFRHGLQVRELRLSDSTCKDPLRPLVTAASIDVRFFGKMLRAEELCYTRLSDAYYEPGNVDRDEPLEVQFPDLGRWTVELTRPDILGIRPERLTFDWEIAPQRMDFSRIRLVWPDREKPMAINGFCFVDLVRQEVYGEIEGLAKTAHIRPLIVTLDVPVALPYMDGFTEVPEPCPSWCAWKVDLVRKDFDLWLDLRPTLGRYNGVPMKGAKGKIHLHNCTRDNSLNYVTTVGPIAGVDTEGRPLDGTVVVVGTNEQNTVTVKATSGQPLADVLKIGGFTGDYVDAGIVGHSVCDLEFRFPRAMTNNYEELNGRGHVEVKGGCLMRMRGFRGLLAVMPSIAPAVTWFSDTTQASCDYRIERGVVKSDNIYIEGSCFSIKMEGSFDAVRNALDFNVRVQFARSDSLVGKVLHPIVWPFTKLLLEFKLTGTAEDPKWSYVTVLDRVMEVVK